MIHDDFPGLAQAREEAMLEAMLTEKTQARAELRDRFAMAALTGMTSNDVGMRATYKDLAEWAYGIADAMLKARGDE